MRDPNKWVSLYIIRKLMYNLHYICSLYMSDKHMGYVGLVLTSILLQGLSTNLVALSGDLCECLQRTPQSFSSAEIKVTETKEAIDMAYPDAAFMIVSCVDDKPTSSTSTR